jgi:arabinogalactan oligomer/maltooligosaccharide transport system substrate-binding protein
MASLLATTVFAAGQAEQPAEAVKLKVWGSNEDQALLKEMVEAFKVANPGKTYVIEYGVVGEPDAKTRYLEDPEAAADVFAFANDQLKDLVSAGALYELSGQFKDSVLKEHGEGSVGSATLNGKLYAFPMTADNGYFLYYDKSVIDAESLKSLDGILAAAQKAGKKVFMDLSNGWYIASFFLGAGGNLGIDANGKQVTDFNNANGIAAGEAIKAFAAHPAFLTGDDAVLTGGMGTVIAAGVSGTWNAKAMKEKLGANYGAAKLPTFTLAGKQVQMSSFAGYKLVGVNKLTKYPVDALSLAAWLTNEANQLKRFQVRGLGPSNSAVASSPEVLATPELAALAQQGAYAVSQNDVLGNYWSPAEAFGALMEAKDYSKSIKEQLDAMVAQIVQ